MKPLFQDGLRALTLLTTLPLPIPPIDSERPGRSMALYPAVGVVVGVLLAGLAFLLSRFQGSNAPLLAPALIVAAWVGLTGALHLDGWADCCDGLLAPVVRERRLEILRDPRLGAFGGVGLVLLLLLKVAALQGCLARPDALLALIIIPTLARWAMVTAAYGFPLAKPDGMAAYFRRGLGRREWLMATTITAVVAVLLLWRGFVLWSAVGIAMWLLAQLARRRIGGLTGDVYGATVELSETVALVVLNFL
jgi:adenosylcobinamide-GDP ribazoletransferase